MTLNPHETSLTNLLGKEHSYSNLANAKSFALSENTNTTDFEDVRSERGKKRLWTTLKIPMRLPPCSAGLAAQPLNVTPLLTDARKTT